MPNKMAQQRSQALIKFNEETGEIEFDAIENPIS